MARPDVRGIRENDAAKPVELQHRLAVEDPIHADTPHQERRPALLAAACPDVPRPAPSAAAPSSAYSTRYSWAELLRRVFAIDVRTCPNCGSRRRLVALISDPPVVRKILRHLGLPAEPPALAPPRSPPQMAFGY